MVIGLSKIRRRVSIYSIAALFAAISFHAAAKVNFIHTDHLGTPVAMTNSPQTATWKADYGPFGKATITTELAQLNLRFPGQYFDEETGLHYNYFRDYDPSTGRYVQSDPIGLAGGLNTYAYALNNPIRFIDQYGLEARRCCRPASIAFGLVDHCRIQTDSITAGMSADPLGCSLPGENAKDPLFSPVLVQDHSCEVSGECETVSNVDEDCVDRELQFGRMLGAFAPWNNCQTFVADVFKKCSTMPSSTGK